MDSKGTKKERMTAMQSKLHITRRSESIFEYILFSMGDSNTCFLSRRTCFIGIVTTATRKMGMGRLEKKFKMSKKTT